MKNESLVRKTKSVSFINQFLSSTLFDHDIEMCLLSFMRFLSFNDKPHQHSSEKFANFYHIYLLQ